MILSQKSLIFKKSLQPKQNRYRKTENEETMIEATIQIQKHLKLFINMKKFKKTLKSIKYRKNIMKEIVQTEKNYIENLKLVVNQIIVPVRDKKISTNFNEIEDFLTVFSNLESIKTLHEKLYAKLQQRFLHYHHFSLFGEVFQEFLPFFKIYFIYCEEFEGNMKFLNKFIKTNEKIRKFIEKKEYQPDLNNQDLTSLLIMPVQRICKYVLFLKDLIRYTPSSHIDYESLQLSLKKFNDINLENNQKMNKCIKNLKLFELQNLFGSDDLLILDAKRDFISEESFEIIINSKAMPTIVYILTDLVLITERFDFLGIYKLQFYILLDEKSSVKSLQNTKYYTDIFSVHGINNCVTFLAGNEENKEKYMNLFENLITNLKGVYDNKIKSLQSNPHILSKKSFQMSFDLEINVIGTEERFFEGFLSQIVYVIEIKTNVYNQRIYLNYSEIYDIYKKTKRQFPTISLPHMERLNIFYKKTKTIETRKILIENFLLILLRNEKIQQEGEFILKFLNLPIEFFNISSRINDSFRCSNLKDGILSEIHLQQQNTPEKKSKKLRKAEFYSSMSKVLIESNEKMNKNYLGFYSVEQDKILREITIKLIDNSQIRIEIFQNTTAIEACELISKKINLLFFEDFKLYIIDTKNEYKLLEDDEVLFQYLFEKEYMMMKQSKAPGSFLRKIGQKIKYSINLKQFFKEKTEIIFKKYLFLPNNLEKNDWTIDIVRTRLIAYQIMNEIAQGKYQLIFNEYSLFAALYGYELYGNFNENLNLIEVFQSINRIIPYEIYKQKNKEYWNIVIIKKWKKLEEKFEEKRNLNKLVHQKTFVEMNIIQLIQKNELYGVTLFESEIYKNNELPNIVILGVKFDGLTIISLDKTKIFYFIQYKDLKDLVVYPKSIIIEFRGKIIRLNTSKSFEISQMINKYQKILNFLNE